MGRRADSRVLWLCIVASLTLALACPSAASAHAVLLGTEPSNESTVDVRPSKVTITFSENVGVAFGGVKAYGPDGRRADRGEASAQGDTVIVPIAAAGSGTYALSWRVISSDGHPVRGAFVFHVRSKSSDEVSRDKALSASAGSRGKDVAFGVARVGILLGVLAAVGGVVFSLLVAPGWRARGLRMALVVALAALLAAYVLDASIAAGLSVGESLRGDSMRAQASTVYGTATLVRIGLARIPHGWLPSACAAGCDASS